jgi:hypothetical protein
MTSRRAHAVCFLAALTPLALTSAIRADLIASTSLESAQGYVPPKDVRSPTGPVVEPGDWGGSTFAGAKGGDDYTGVRAEGAGSAYAGDQFFIMQRSGTDGTYTDIVIRRKFPVQTGLLYYRWAFRIDSQAAQSPYWGTGGTTNHINFTLDRKMTTLDNTANDASYIDHIGTETMRIELPQDGRIIVKQSSFGGDITLTKKWDGTTTDGSDPVASALNNWVKVEVLLDIASQRWWLFWNGTYLGSYRFRKDLTSSGGIRQVNMIRFQAPRLDYVARGERLRIDDIELRTDPPAALPTCLTLVSPGDVAATANAGEPATPSTIDYTVHNFGPNEQTWTATELDQNQIPADVSWLSLSTGASPPASTLTGQLSSMGSTTVTATINTTGVSGGDHYAYVKFTDNCDPQNVAIRQIRLTVVGCTWAVSGCNEVRSYLLDYPDMTVAPVVYRVTNTGQQSMSYSVAKTGSSCLEGMWTLANDTGTLNAGEYADVTATFHPQVLDGQSTDDSYSCDLTFTDNCSAQVISRTIRLRYMGVGDAPVFQYNGDVDPLATGSTSPGMHCALYREDNLTVNGAVERDLFADNGWAYRIQDDSSIKTKYRFLFDETGNPLEIANEIGATIVARVRVREQSGGQSGGLFLWEEDNVSCTYHWGGPTGVVTETTRSTAPIVTLAPSTDFAILRMTAIGRKDAPWDCSRLIRLYFDEDPTPVIEMVGPSPESTSYEGFGFGAGSTSGTCDIAFDWITGTNAGAFAPGEEEAVLGRSLVPDFCPKPFADADRDGDVDQDDFAAFQLCYTGSHDPGGLFDRLHCSCFDREQDGDVDGDDYGAFEHCATGPGILFDPQNPPPGCVTP